MLTLGMFRIALTRRLALVLAATLALAGCGTAAPSSAAVATPTLAPSAAATTIPATPSTEPSGSPLPTTWQPLDLFPEADGPFDPGLLLSDLSGFTLTARAHDVASAWSSPDGETWTMAALPAVPQSKASPYTGAAGATRTVLLGVGDGQCAHPVADFTWARPAGGDWAAAPWQDLFCAGGQGSIATDGQTFVVAGTGAGDQPFLWSSQDGLSWTATPIAIEIAPAAVVWTGTEFLSLARGGSGFTTLTSADGVAWASAPAIGLPGGGLPRLFTLSGQVVALLGAGGTLVAYQRQADGSWLSVPTTGLDASADDVTNAPTTSGLGFIFLSTTAGGGTVLASNDGLAWHSVATPAATRFIGAAVFGDRAVLLGAQDTGSGTQPLAWWGPNTLLPGG
jgi:hypothetical protein